MDDKRGNLTLEFIRIADMNDSIRSGKGKDRGLVLWENVEGVLTDKSNAFGSFISGLAGLKSTIPNEKIGRSGYIEGDKRNVAWRVLDGKYFGLPQQRRRVFVVAGSSDSNVMSILFERERRSIDQQYPKSSLNFEVEGSKFEVFREYTDCLYSAYGTKWNGNAAAYNGSLFVVEESRIRRLSPIECERLMGFPDGYTEVKGSSRTKRYQSLGNSWSVPVIRWIGKRLINNPDEDMMVDKEINATPIPNDIVIGSLKGIVEPCSIKPLYISPVGAAGILRRSDERKINMNSRLKNHLLKSAQTMDYKEIEAKSRVQKRGRYSN